MKKPKFHPVFSISTNETGSHRTLYPIGTKACDLVHDYDPKTGEPTYAEGVFIEMVTPEQAKQIKKLGKMTFSSTEDFENWRYGIDSEEDLPYNPLER